MYGFYWRFLQASAAGPFGGTYETRVTVRTPRARPGRPRDRVPARTLLDEWAHLRPCNSDDERTGALADFLHTYNHHRCHTALGGRLPISRVDNAAGQYT
ncbi:Integrase catalytic domain-containing protein OS=Streptomyces aurantiogriseus OX=66870 GN=GCM10010251_50540 PE=4 SV=1 [Streptomyces aurantiogriseus]